jgi:hypothetical protein
MGQTGEMRRKDRRALDARPQVVFSRLPSPRKNRMDAETRIETDK